MKNKKIILASTSPRRIEIMKAHDIDPVIIPPDVDETIPEQLDKDEAVMYLALKKALAAEKIFLNNPEQYQFSAEAAEDNPVIIAADTIVFKNQMIGKPSDSEHARFILRTLRNTSHYVVTGMALLEAQMTVRRIFSEVTKVFFTNYSDEDIEQYIATDEPWDKAGGYAIQGYFSKYIHHIEGDRDNVIGFPWTRIEKELKEL